jgi:hypothetical protein
MVEDAEITDDFAGQSGYVDETYGPNTEYINNAKELVRVSDCEICHPIYTIIDEDGEIVTERVVYDETTGLINVDTNTGLSFSGYFTVKYPETE